MQNFRRARFWLRALLGASLLLSSSPLVRSQDAPNTSTSSTDPAPDLKSLAAAVSGLQSQVQSLNSQMSELRTAEQRALLEAGELRAELDRMRDQSPARTGGGYEAYGPPASQASSPSAALAPSQGGQAPGSSLEDRVSNLEEDQHLVNDQIAEQSQTKIESGSKYRVRLSGIVLMNLFDNRGTVDSQDVPEVALQPNLLDPASSFGGSLRQSQIGLEAFGPDVAGAHTSANLQFDFAGGFPNVPNGVSMGIVRLRTGTVRFDWTNTSIVAGQDQLFFAPLAPSSMSSLATPALSYVGNLWGWIPQVRVEHRVGLQRGSHLLFQGGILDSLSGDAPQSLYLRVPTWGERSGQPAYAARVSWSLPMSGDQSLTVGAGGYYGRQNWGFNRNVDGWASTIDVTVPLGELFEFTGEFYRGQAVGGLSGAIGQDALFSGPLASPTAFIQGLDSLGGWAQLKFKPTAKLEINGAFGQDDPFASELRRFPGSQSFYGTLLSSNRSPFVNFIYQLRSDVLFSAEYRRVRTFVLDNGSYSADHISLSLGYAF